MQPMCPVQQPMRHQTNAAPAIRKNTPKKDQPYSCRFLKARAIVTRKKAAISTPAATSAGLMPVIARKIATEKVNVNA